MKGNIFTFLEKHRFLNMIPDSFFYALSGVDMSLSVKLCINNFNKNINLKLTGLQSSCADILCLEQGPAQLVHMRNNSGSTNTFAGINKIGVSLFI